MTFGTEALLPEWQCHKRVRAAQIVEIRDRADGGQELRFDGGYVTTVDATWAQRHNAKVGGYYVVYDDGYGSFSPRAAFEGGYTRINEPHRLNSTVQGA